MGHLQEISVDEFDNIGFCCHRNVGLPTTFSVLKCISEQPFGSWLGKDLEVNGKVIADANPFVAPNVFAFNIFSEKGQSMPFSEFEWDGPLHKAAAGGAANCWHSGDWATCRPHGSHERSLYKDVTGLAGLKNGRRQTLILTGPFLNGHSFNWNKFHALICDFLFQQFPCHQRAAFMI